MGAIAFDPLEYTHDLEAVGVPRKQAEIHARAMTDRFIHNFESLPRFIGYALVTTDFLDSRISESEARVDMQFTALEARLNVKIDALSADMAVRFERMDGKFSRIIDN